MAYGAAAATLPEREPVEFITPECRSCSDPLYEISRSPVPGICRYCLKEQMDERIMDDNARAAKFQSDHKAKVSAKADKSFPYLVLMVAIAGTVLGLAAWYVPRAIGWIIFRLAGG